MNIHHCNLPISTQIPECRVISAWANSNVTSESPALQALRLGDLNTNRLLDPNLMLKVRDEYDENNCRG